MKQVIFANSSSGSPDSPEWHAWRKGGIGGSDAAVPGFYAGLNSKPTWGKGQSELWQLKTGQLILPYQSNWATERGRAGEEPARKAFEAATGIIISPIFGEMDKYPFIRSSFDGVDFFRTLLGEIKCPGIASHEAARRGIIPDYYFTQMLHQGLTLWGDPNDGEWDGKRMFYISYVPETADLVYVEVLCDELIVQDKAVQLMKAEVEFWEHVVNMTEPAGKAWEEAAADYIEAKLQADLATATLAAVTARLEAIMGDRNDVEGGGVVGSKSQRAGSVSYREAADVLMKWYGIDPSEFLPQFKGESKDMTSFRIQKSNGTRKKKGKAEGVLSKEAVEAEIARISAAELKEGSAAFTW